MVTPLLPDDTAALSIASDLRVVLGRLRRRLRAQGSFDELTASQISALSHLERDGPMTVSALARAEGMRPQSMSAIVTALDAAGLVEGTPDAGDGRKVLLSPSPACRERLAAARAAREDWLVRTVLNAFTPAERVQLATGIALLKRMTDR